MPIPKRQIDRSDEPETWKEACGYDPWYVIKVSSKGRITIVPNITKDPYGNQFVRLHGVDVPVDYLVASLFISNPTESEVVIHKDGNVQNNDVANLQWNPSKKSDNMVRPQYQVKDERMMNRIVEFVETSLFQTPLRYATHPYVRQEQTKRLAEEHQERMKDPDYAAAMGGRQEFRAAVASQVDLSDPNTRVSLPRSLDTTNPEMRIYKTSPSGNEYEYEVHTKNVMEAYKESVEQRKNAENPVKNEFGEKVQTAAEAFGYRYSNTGDMNTKLIQSHNTLNKLTTDESVYEQLDMAFAPPVSEEVRKKELIEREIAKISYDEWEKNSDVDRLQEKVARIREIPQPELLKVRTGPRPKNAAKRVLCTKRTGEEVIFNSTTQAARALGVDTGSISKCARGIVKTVEGMKFRYIDAEDVEGVLDEYIEMINDRILEKMSDEEKNKGKKNGKK